MRSKYILASLIILVLIAALVLPESASAQKILRWAYSMPSKRSMGYGWESLGPEFEKRTNGRYKVEYYPGETLFKIVAAYDSILSNVAQISNISIGQMEKRLPLSNVALLPALDFPPTREGRFASAKAFFEMYQKLPEIQGEYKGLKVFGYHQLFPYVLVSKRKEISLPEHFKGLKVGGSGIRMRMVTSSGGAEVTQVPPDAYMNMDKGVVDASFVSWSQIWDYKLWEAAKYVYDFGFGAGAFALIMNLDTWNGMSAGDQKAFMELWAKAFEIGNENNWEEIQKGKKAATDAGVKIRKPTETEMAAWRKVAAPIVEQWVTEAKKSGAKDPEAVLAEWQRLLEAHKE